MANVILSEPELDAIAAKVASRVPARPLSVDEMTALAAAVAALLKPGAPTPDPEPKPPTDPDPKPPTDLPAGTVKALVLDPSKGVGAWSGTSEVGGSLSFVGAPGRPGRTAIKVSVTGERAEVKQTPSGHIPHGATYYCAWSTMLGEGWKDTDSHQIIWQLHGVGDKLSPAVSVRADNGEWVLVVRGGTNDDIKVRKSIGAAKPGVWYDFVLCGVSSDTNNGKVIVWLREAGKAWAQPITVTGPTAASHKNGQYLRMGLYGGNVSPANVLYHDGIRFGPSMGEMGAAFPDRQGPQ